jgi:hypothetical protein
MSLLLVAALWSPLAFAQATQGVDVSVVRGDGADDCISSEGLEAEVRKRLGRDVFVPPVRQHVECLVTREGNAFVARLFERDFVGRRMGDRVLSVATSDCRLLDDALALAVALIIDPEYLTGAASGRSDTASSPAAGARARSNRNSSDSVSASSVTLLDATAQVRPQAFANVGDTRMLLGAGAAVDLLPGVAPTFSFSVQRRWRGWFHGHAAVLYVPEGKAPDVAPAVSFGMTALKLGNCLEGQEDFAFFGCAGLAAGGIHAVVHDPKPAEVGERGWAAVSLEAGTRTVVGPLVVELRGQLLVPLVRWKFKFTSQTEVFQQGAVCPGLSLLIGPHFP